MYKIFIIIFISLVLVCYSCINKENVALLEKAENFLLTGYPDSALLFLETIDISEKMDTEKYAKYCLLLVSIHQENKICIKDDTLIHHAVNYYQRHPLNSKDYIKALILQGNVYEEQDLDNDAMLSYRKAYDQSIQYKNIDLQALCAYYIGSISKYEEQYENGIVWLQEAKTKFQKTNNDTMYRRSLKQIGDCYLLWGKVDSALSIYKRTLKLVPPHRKKTQAEIYKNMSIASRINGDKEESLANIRESIHLVPDNHSYPIQYTILALIHKESGRMDSAAYYRNQALKIAIDLNSSSLIQKSYEYLWDTGHTSKINKYTILKSLNDSLYQKMSYEVDKYERLYNQEYLKRKNKNLTVQIQYYLYIFFLVIFLIIIYIVYLRSRKKIIRMQQEKELDDRQQLINTIRGSIYQRLESYKKMVRLSISPQKQKYTRFLQEYNKILFDSDEDFLFDWETAKTFVNNLYDNYIGRLKNLKPELTDIEIQIIILLKLGFHISEISEILEKSIHTIYRYCSDFRKKQKISSDQSIITYIDERIKLDNIYVSPTYEKILKVFLNHKKTNSASIKY
jgi:tetratricopeptide (TPR) repeat protein/DNA-binding CsgD family transcriptional regulator